MLIQYLASLLSAKRVSITASCVLLFVMDSCPLRIGLRPQNHLIEPVGKSSDGDGSSIISTIVGFETGTWI